MATDLQALAQVLEASLDPTKNKQGQYTSAPLSLFILTKKVAESAISQEERNPGFSVSLLQIVAGESFGTTARLASALYFKNLIKRSWTVKTLIPES